jgi:murein DD-endopeptidase MepM/ murein hydrolase activator NlpD
MRQFQRWLWLFILIIIVALSSWEVGATTTDPGVLQQLIQKTQQEIFQQKKREKSVLNNLLTQQQVLSKLEGNYQQTKQTLGIAQNKVNSTRRELAELQNNFDALEANLGAKQDLLNKRLVAIYKSGPQTYLDMVFMAKDFIDLVSRFDMIAYFVKDDLRKIDNIKQTKTLVYQQTIVIQNKKVQVESEYQKTLELQNQLAKEQQKIAIQVGSTKEELQDIQTNRRKLEKALDEFEQTSREIEAEIRRKEKSNPGKILGSGKIIWPVKGPITSPFGWRFHPILRKQMYHSGLDIAVSSGTQVHAADAGVVVVSGWQGGYGNFVAIDHGNGIATCYGHNSQLLVREGEKVYQGQVIALSGSTGLSTGPHVHFEVRRNGVPVDPMSYLP